MQVKQEKRAVRSYVMKNMKELEMAGSKLKLPSDVMDEARRLYIEVYSRDLNRGYSKKDVQCAILYTACREAGLPVLLDVFSKELGSDRIGTGRMYTKIRRAFNITPKPITSEALLCSLCDELGVDDLVRDKALSVMHSEKGNELWGYCKAHVIASCSLYVASTLLGMELKVSDITERLGVSVNTVILYSSKYFRAMGSEDTVKDTNEKEGEE
jgi:transcription initiation factor TFIIIB Brf1 subunit/transcription initiation factor TFIIB